MLATFYFGEWFSVRGFLQPSKYLRTTTSIVIKQSLLSSICGNYITCNRLILAASISLLLLGYMIQSLRPCSSCSYIGWYHPLRSWPLVDFTKMIDSENECPAILYKEMILKTVEPLKELGFVWWSNKLFEPAKPKLTEEQIQPPNYLDFFWKIKALCVSWEDCLTELFDYKKKRGKYKCFT